METCLGAVGQWKIVFCCDELVCASSIDVDHLDGPESARSAGDCVQSAHGDREHTVDDGTTNLLDSSTE